MLAEQRRHRVIERPRHSKERCRFTGSMAALSVLVCWRRSRPCTDPPITLQLPTQRDENSPAKETGWILEVHLHRNRVQAENRVKTREKSTLARLPLRCQRSGGSPSSSCRQQEELRSSESSAAKHTNTPPHPASHRESTYSLFRTDFVLRTVHHLSPRAMDQAPAALVVPTSHHFPEQGCDLQSSCYSGAGRSSLAFAFRTKSLLTVSLYVLSRV